MKHQYLIALGSNMRVPGIGSPRQVLAALPELIEGHGHNVIAQSSTIASAPIGPSQRTYANGALVVESELEPDGMLAFLQLLEASMGRRRRGTRWRARPLDLDIILWSGGAWDTPNLSIPHPLFCSRPFVLRPAAQIAPLWRDPVTGMTLRQLATRRAGHD